MENPSRRALSIQGTGQASGGIFGHVSIRGVGTIDGDLTCDKLDVQGIAKLNGDVTARRVHIQGKADVAGAIAAQELHIEGQLSTQGDCTTEAFIVTGGCKVAGLLNAGRVDIHLYSPSQIREVGGEVIRVRVKRKWFGIHRLSRLTVDAIEADEVTLEHTNAQVVRGKIIHIGMNCDIDLVEYTDQLHVVSEATVRNQRKLERA